VRSPYAPLLCAATKASGSVASFPTEAIPLCSSVEREAVVGYGESFRARDYSVGRALYPYSIILPNFHAAFSRPDKSLHDRGQAGLSIQIPGELGLPPLFIEGLRTEC